MVSKLPVLAAASSLAASATNLSLASLNLPASFQISGLARDLSDSVLAANPAQGKALKVATTCALSYATLASNGARPLAMAPIRPN